MHIRFENTWLYYQCWRLQQQQRQWGHTWNAFSFCVLSFRSFFLSSLLALYTFQTQYWIMYKIHRNYEFEIRFTAVGFVCKHTLFVSLVSWLIVWCMRVLCVVYLSPFIPTHSWSLSFVPMFYFTWLYPCRVCLRLWVWVCTINWRECAAGAML